ncbi:glycoside hydrolase family 24 protein [Modicisalibacter coralii]|uniref:glycoside hydrolase family 24 protein n=1 Tax=Modicisalibacter coralii TaxID=2304602 RepID=UPI00100A29F6
MPAYAPRTWLGEAELVPFDPPVDPAADDAGNLAAFLDMLAHAEGTVRFGDQDGYNVLVGGGLFHSYADHPRRSIWLPAYGIHSTAAGRAQFLESTWDDLVERFGFTDFTPASQDAAATQLIRQCKALRLIYDGRIRDAIHACRTIWASLPGAGYGQREVAMAELVDVYRQAGGHVA